MGGMKDNNKEIHELRHIFLIGIGHKVHSKPAVYRNTFPEKFKA
ncbi:hypothetical protein ADIARSV_2730 [Arcticibacter svalbardensis MN12-7]|uniref:Uncharacterized protein n=1 Tax=Arcticibacter svalbardensis MN12-7 TaxID=1150600 RepID=R9GQL0_9SPHI|nr:hypothetical protein ADIARSV_2730 [Arcticibacter svalbardensis MN12-7]